MAELFEDIGKMIVDPLGFVFGQKFMKYGLRPRDRETNRKIKLYKENLKKIIDKRISEIK